MDPDWRDTCRDGYWLLPQINTLKFHLISSMIATLFFPVSIKWIQIVQCHKKRRWTLFQIKAPHEFSSHPPNSVTRLKPIYSLHNLRKLVCFSQKRIENECERKQWLNVTKNDNGRYGVHMSSNFNEISFVSRCIIGQYHQMQSVNLKGQVWRN